MTDRTNMSGWSDDPALPPSPTTSSSTRTRKTKTMQTKIKKSHYTLILNPNVTNHFLFLTYCINDVKKAGGKVNLRFDKHEELRDKVKGMIYQIPSNTTNPLSTTSGFAAGKIQLFECKVVSGEWVAVADTGTNDVDHIFETTATLPLGKTEGQESGETPAKVAEEVMAGILPLANAMGVEADDLSGLLLGEEEWTVVDNMGEME